MAPNRPQALIRRVFTEPRSLTNRQRSGIEEPDPGGPLRSLRPRRERPRRRRAAEQRDELAASDESCHLIPPAGRLRPNDSTVKGRFPRRPSRLRLPGLFRADAVASAYPAGRVHPACLPMKAPKPPSGALWLRESTARVKLTGSPAMT